MLFALGQEGKCLDRQARLSKVLACKTETYLREHKQRMAPQFSAQNDQRGECFFSHKSRDHSRHGRRQPDYIITVSSTWSKYPHGTGSIGCKIQEGGRVMETCAKPQKATEVRQCVAGWIPCKETPGDNHTQP